MKALREGALWLAVFGSVAGVSVALRTWEANSEAATCAVGTEVTRVGDLARPCDATAGMYAPVLVRTGQVGLD